MPAPKVPSLLSAWQVVHDLLPNKISPLAASPTLPDELLEDELLLELEELLELLELEELELDELELLELDEELLELEELELEELLELLVELDELLELDVPSLLPPQAVKVASSARTKNFCIVNTLESLYYCVGNGALC